ncbi:MAG: AMIN-like domain-containing (lipo)protein [Thermoleophilia bacterium]
MRLVRTLIVTSLVAVVLALAAAPAGAQSTPILVDVRAGSHTGYDRVVFEFEGAVPEHRIGYVDQLVEDGSGNPVEVAGAADLEVVFEGANAHEENGSPTVSPRRFSPGLPAVKEIAQLGDFEAVVSYGIGIDRRRPITVSTLSGPSRLVIDVATTGTGGSTGGGGDTGALPFTGSRTRTLLITALALVATGTTVLLLGRLTRAA